MNIYSKKIRWKYLLFLGAIFIGFGSLWYTNQLVQRLTNEERKKVEMWAEATRLIVDTEISSESLEFMLAVIQNNSTIPVILVDEEDNIVQMKNVDSVRFHNPKYIDREVQKMKEENEPIEIKLNETDKQYLYYSRSTILKNLSYYPFVQLTVILLFIFVAYLAFSSSRKAEQNKVWVGLSKETAHQLGTPISSLLAWKEVLKLKLENNELVDEFEKDINRLEKITERFSKIGARPNLHDENLNEIVETAVHYLKTRSSQKITYNLKVPDVPVIIPLNPPLFEWVIENICKNAMDAIEGQGTINIEITDNLKFVFIDISDSGKGIPRTKFKTIFKPGYTTKGSGWGLGLSLTKRIVEDYHHGKIFVADSETGKGTTFRITLNR